MPVVRKLHLKQVKPYFSSTALFQKLCTRCLRWYGHVQRAELSISGITNLVIPGPRNCGRPRKTWLEYIRKDLVHYNLAE